MSFALIRETDGAWIDGPLAEAPTPGDGEYVIEVALGYPESCLWSPALQGFVDIPAPMPILSPLAYQRRFTQAERIAIRGSADPAVIDWRELAAIAAEIDLTDPDVIAGTHYLEMQGLIGAGRAAEILSY